MSGRRITVRLTPAQYSALAGAVAERSESLSDQAEHKVSTATREAATLERAWDAIRNGWHGVTK